MTFGVWCRHYRKTAWIRALPGLVCAVHLMLIAWILLCDRGDSAQ